MRAIDTVYHLVDAANWASVQRRGLLSTRRLLAASGELDDEALRRHRTAGQRLSCGALIRDQRPMPPAALARCLGDGLQPGDWYALLNSKVFFWLDRARLNRQRQACGPAPQVVLVVDAARLLARHGDTASVTPINTGNAMRAAAPRNLTTFVPYARWRRDGWAHERIAGVALRAAAHKPVELTIADAVPDILAFVTAVVPLAAHAALPAEPAVGGAAR